MRGNNLKLLGVWIMVKDLPYVETSDSGIVLNAWGLQGDQARKQEWFKAEVVAVSDKLRDLKVGDHVIYDAYSGGYDIDWNGSEHFITKPSNVWAVLEQ